MASPPTESHRKIMDVIARLTADGDTFEPQDAADLIALVPVTPRRWGLRFVLDDQRTGDARVVGAAYGRRIADYEIDHNPGQVKINLARKAAGFEAGQGFLLRYDRTTGRAVRLDRSHWSNLQILQMSLRRWRPWKTPRRRGIAEVYGLPRRAL